MHLSSHETQQDPRRRMTRHHTDAVRCPLGDIVDLSGAGMRIAVKGRCPIKVGQTVPMKLRTPHGSIAVAARAVWRRRTGLLGGCLLGFEFDGIKPGQAVALGTIARFGFIAQGRVKPAESQVKPDPNRVNDHPEQIEATIVLAKYYERLGLPTDASPARIKDAYRRLARQHHPDVAPGPESQRRFIELREAYDLLIDQQRRAG